MTSEKTEHSHPPVKHGKVGVLLVNLGTPDRTDYTSVRRYLKEFLMDKRVIEWPRIACLNDSSEGMTVLEKVVRRELSGWVNPRSR